MGLFTDIFLKIADKLGLTVQYKDAAGPAAYKENASINLTATVANRVTTLVMMDSGATVDGDNARAQYLRDTLEKLLDETIPAGAEVALGTGDCLLKPWTDGRRIGVDLISGDDFRICDSIGEYVKSVIIRADVFKNHRTGKTFERFEGQRIDEEGTVTISQFVYCDGKEVPPLAWPDAWRDLEPETVITGCDQLLFGRIKCPTINRGDLNSPNGVRITYGLDPVMDNAVKAYNRFNDEMEKKETMIFADRTLFAADKDGNRVLPKGKGRLFQAVRGKDGGSLIQEFSPDLRADDLEKGIDVNFRMLEMLAGLDEGILTKPSTKFATATEIKTSLQLTFAFITKFRQRIMTGVSDMLRAIDVLANLNGLTPMGDWDVIFDWSSSYIENLEEQFNRLVIAHGIGAVDTAEVRAWVMDEDKKTAEERVNEIGRDDITGDAEPAE